jgi:hypothetical protein
VEIKGRLLQGSRLKPPEEIVDYIVEIEAPAEHKLGPGQVLGLL